MAAVLETLPVALTSKLEIWLLSKRRETQQRDNKSWLSFDLWHAGALTV